MIVHGMFNVRRSTFHCTALFGMAYTKSQNVIQDNCKPDRSQKTNRRPERSEDNRMSVLCACALQP